MCPNAFRVLHRRTRRRPGIVVGLLAALLLSATPAILLAQGFGGTVSDILVRADSLLAQQRANEAVVQYQEARTLCATPAEVVASLRGEAQAHIAMREFLPAAGLLEEAAQRFPDDPRMADLLYLAGFARRQGGDPAAAVPLLKKALERGPTPDLMPMVKFQLAQALRLTGAPDEVVTLLKDFETEYDKSPLVPNVLYMLAIAAHDAGHLEESETAYRHLVDTYPHTQATLEALYDLGDVLAARGKGREAAEYFRRYANGNPSSPVAARSMERAGDAAFFSSPREAAMMYGVARVKAAQNPPAPTPDLQVSRWLGLKWWIADTLTSAPVMVGIGVAALLAAGGIAWLVRRRARAARAAAGA